MASATTPLAILHVTTFLQGGAGRVVSDLAVRQAHEGHRVWVSTGTRGPLGYDNDPANLSLLEDAGVEVVTADSFFDRQLPSILRAVGTLHGRLRAEPLSVVHAHAACAALGGLLLRSRRRSSLPVIHTMHGWGVSKTPEMAETDLRVMSQLDNVVAVSPAGRRLLVEKGLAGDLIVVIPNGIETETASGVRDSTLSAHLRRVRESGGEIVGCIGSIGPRKNQALLVEAFASLSTRRPNLALVLVGAGEDLVPLRARVEAAGLGDRVTFTGYLPDAAGFLPLFDVAVLPSRNEGLPITVLEALRSGTLLIASDIPEHRDLLEDGRLGLLFASDSQPALEAALVRALDMPSHERSTMVRSGVERQRASYSLGAMAEAYEKLYRNVLDRVSACRAGSVLPGGLLGGGHFEP
jgi:L-malate glycosyltransferase